MPSQTKIRPAPASGKPLSRWKKVLLVGLGLIYVLSPLDLIPEAFVPVVGWLDDIGIMALIARQVFFRDKA